MRETSKAIAAYDLYRDMGPQRSMDALHKTYPALTPSERRLKEWSRLHGWVARARAHDQAIADASATRDKAARIADGERRRTQRLSIADAEHRIVLARLRRLVESNEQVSVLEAVKLALHADTTERLDLGEATERTEISGPDGGLLSLIVDVRGLSDADLDAYADRLRERLGAGAELRPIPGE